MVEAIEQRSGGFVGRQRIRRPSQVKDVLFQLALHLPNGIDRFKSGAGHPAMDELDGFRAGKKCHKRNIRNFNIYIIFGRKTRWLRAEPPQLYLFSQTSGDAQELHLVVLAGRLEQVVKSLTGGAVVAAIAATASGDHKVTRRCRGARNDGSGPRSP